MPDIKWGYAINQWNPVRREQQERTFKEMSVCCFRGVELIEGSGRWEPLGRPELTELNFGSVHDFIDFLHQCGIDQVPSYLYDPGLYSEEESSYGRSPANPKDHEGIIESIKAFTTFLRDVGGSCLVVRPIGSYWREAPLTEEKFKNTATCWNSVGKMTKQYGIRTALHVDCLCALHSMSDIDKILAMTDPELVGLAIDTAELTIAGIDPLKLYDKHHNRVRHFHFKDTHAIDTLEEFKIPNAEVFLLKGGGKREIERWFWEMGTPEGLVDFPALMKSIRSRGYKGWIIVESDPSPNPAESTMLNSWYVQHVLAKI
jgi:inosose dehydratase